MTHKQVRAILGLLRLQTLTCPVSLLDCLSKDDLPGRFLACKWLLDRPTDLLLQHKTLDGLRQKLPQGLVRLDRSPQDDPKIIETWV